MRAASLQSILANYQVLFAVWEESKESSLDSAIKARIIGVHAQMASFDFLFGVSLGALILTHSDNLSKMLQHQSMSAAEGQHIAKLTLDDLKSIRQPGQFQLFLSESYLISSVLTFHLHLYRVSAAHLDNFKLGLQTVIIALQLRITTGCSTTRH